ncbi:MAG TPA: NAD(P)/FAD-dependent oxidoreductase [Oscillospiraceae bacterium]|nr:NAD(P)/FAD-dependent oxidoreductase [Oscillospiraceae bacterium]HPS35184.1 NAD(P)/FAD-dependent oxidoreductase [Oscillospiraceae bacterium]
MSKSYDIAIIGAGVCGCAAAFELSKYDVSSVLIEREPDVSMGTTKANSGIIHAGFDAEPGTLMAKYNVKGAAMMPKLAKELSVEYEQIGSLVVAFDDADQKTLGELYRRGIQNGVNVELIGKERLHGMEPNLSDSAVEALWAPEAGIVSPWDLCLAFAETAVKNGCELRLDSPVTGMKRENGVWKITIEEKTIAARCVINAAGLFSDKIAEMAGAEKFEIKPVKGQYYLLDRSQGNVFSHVMFQCPSAAGKGVLISPTVTGNLLVGPDAAAQLSRIDFGTDKNALSYVKERADVDTDAVNYRENIRNFAGLRAYSDRGDFIIGPDNKSENFINIAGMKSPGLTSAAAIALDLPGMIRGFGLEMKPKNEVVTTRKKVRFASANETERKSLIAKNPSYGRIVCRCNTITEGEVLDALHSPIPPKTLDGVKRRCGTGMGRCQGGFCSPLVHELISRELGIPYEKVEKEKAGSYIVTGPTKETGK